MRQVLLSFVAGLLGGGIGAVAATRWIPGGRGGPDTPVASEASSLDEIREQLRELRALADRPRELAAPAASGGRASPGGSAAAPDAAAAAALSGGAPSPALAEAIEKAVAAGIEHARKQDPGAFGPPKPEPKKRAPLADVARDLNLSSAQEDDIRRAYAESTEKLLKLMAEPDSTPDALRRELEEVKNDPAKRTALTFKYMPKLISKLGDVLAIQAERDTKIHKALGRENVPKFEQYKIAEEDPFGLDGDSITVGASVGGN